MTSTESEVKTLFDRRSEAFWTKDIDRLMACYAPDIIYFDLVPGLENRLQYTGSAALRGRFLHMFAGWQSAIGQYIRDLQIVANGELAFASMLIRASGTLTNGHEVGYWVRATSCCQRSDLGWVIAHEHISLPVEMASGRAAMDLES
jgi:ketosteroid isomerase-like protein